MAQWSIDSVPDQTGRVAVVTGANSGLGLETALGLAQRGAQVILACRDQAKTEAAIARIRGRHPAARVEFMALDLADLASVAGFAGQVMGRLERLDLLINNAGVMALPLRRTKDGFEMQVGTNHLGHFALTGRLLPLVQKTGGSRIVTVASLAHRRGRIDLDDLNWERRPYSKWDAYGQAKLANLVFALELHRRLAASGSKTISTAAHPGFAATNLLTAGPIMEKSAIAKAVMSLSGALLAQSSAKGAIPTLHAAMTPGIAGGSYWGPDGPFEMWGGAPAPAVALKKAQSEKTGAGLWALSEKLTGVSYLS
ncbi:SDR family NAD(P)-dependent oxidoreductase [Oleomonas cavernae]|uniref:SDR family NAD(P)-dependent oxidoreductase n=1 Tax=Oleomonas cavernae TaxID=2320859 RepID=A0A418WEI3_9PROT|nr:oxidoreductase [Oleomonas cavernae]RJF88417.1 SDR family NAD(P)-dependent oxidoreductase [Oleomonas cavernae]